MRGSSSGKKNADISNQAIAEEVPPEFFMASSLTPRNVENTPLARKAPKVPTLPEFKKVSDISEIYSAFTQANLKYRVLQKKEKERLIN